MSGHPKANQCAFFLRPWIPLRRNESLSLLDSMRGVRFEALLTDNRLDAAPRRNTAERPMERLLAELVPKHLVHTPVQAADAGRRSVNGDARDWTTLTRRH